jgi:uncharacterized protein YndB with AHSA1/START domain
MLANAIERDIFIDASVESVWTILTEAEHIKEWFSPGGAEMDARVGGKGRLVFESGMTEVLHIVKVEPPHAFSYRWCSPQGEEATADNSTLVDFTLVSEAGGTRLRVVESGLLDLPWTDEVKQSFFADHSLGWTEKVQSVADRVAAVKVSA